MPEAQVEGRLHELLGEEKSWKKCKKHVKHAKTCHVKPGFQKGCVVMMWGWPHGYSSNDIEDGWLFFLFLDSWELGPGSEM